MNTTVYTTTTLGARRRTSRVSGMHAVARATTRQAATAYADRVVADLRAEGAVLVGFKVCTDIGKWRTSRPIDEAHDLIASTYGDDAEVWGINEAGEFTGSCY